jgi:crossover junction endodeoxyribonuclease RusA
MELYLMSALPPSVNHYLGHRGVMRNGKPVSVSYITTEASKYKEQFKEYVIEQVDKQNWKLTPNKQQHFYVDTVFYFDKLNRDCNNYFKVMLDAITDTKRIWLDDNVVCERVQRIYYDADNPRIEIVIRPVEYIGVFDNASQLGEFESNCFGCTRYVRNCSILRNAKI